MIEVIINRKTHRVNVEPDTPLLWVIRDTLKLTGTKYGCGIEQCGVHGSFERTSRSIMRNQNWRSCR